MDIKTLADLSEIIDLCRKKGIERVSIGKDTIELTLKEKIPVPRRKRQASSANEPNTIQTPDTLTEDQILFWSSAGISESTN